LVSERRLRVYGRVKWPNTDGEILALQHFGDYSMKKTQIALAALALAASTAAVADVAVSGRFDYAYTSASSGGGSDPTGVQGGLLAPNFINVTGSEDLGGMKASFNWVNLVTNSGALINANANVGLSTDAYGIKLGRVTDTFLAGVLAFDVTGGGNMGSAVSPILQFGATGAFHSNAVQVNANAAGVAVAATVIGQDSTGGGRGDYSLSASTDLGGIKVGGAYSQKTQASGKSTTNSFGGVGTTIAGVSVNGNYMKLNTTTVLGLNAAVPLADALTATAGYYDYSDSTTRGNAGSVLSIGAKYALSKSTTVFANYEKVTGGAVAMQGAVGYNGGTQRGIALIGVAQSF